MAFLRGYFIPGAFEGIKSKVVLTGIATSGYAATALVGLLVYAKPDERAGGVFTIGASVVAYGLSLAAIWENADGPQEFWWPAIWAAGITAVLGQVSLFNIGFGRSEGTLVFWFKIAAQLLFACVFLMLLVIAAIPHD